MTGSLVSRMDRRHFLKGTASTLGALASVSLLQACGTTESSSSSHDLHFLGYDTPENVAAVIAGFKASTGITVQYESVPFDQLNDVVQTRIGSSDTSFDVYTVDQPRTAALVHRRFLPALTAEQAEAKKVLLESSIAGSTVDNTMYGLPTSTSTQLLYYNIDLLQKANAAMPTTDPAQRWTWEQVIAVGQQAQRAGAQWGAMFEQISRYYQLQPLFESTGGGSGLRGSDLLTIDITNPGWIKAATFYRDLFANKIGPRGIDANQSSSLFTNGQVAFFIGGPWLIPTFQAIKGLNFGIAAHPYFTGGKPATPTGSWSLGMNPYSTRKDTAVKFMSYASLNAKGSRFINGPGGMPSNTQALQNFLATLPANNDYQKGVNTLIDYELNHTTVLRPPTIGYIQFEDVMNETLEDIRNGVDPLKRLQDATEELKEVFSRL